MLPLPGESNREYNDRLKQIARDAIMANPLGAAKGVFSSFLNHGINNVLLFPLRNDLQSPAELLTPVDAFWEGWEGTPTPSQLALLLFYVFLLGLGITAAWHRNGWLGLLPLALNLVYNLWTSLALLSGQRFMLTMDWSIYLYYMVGLFALLKIFLLTLERGRLTMLKWSEANSFSFVQYFEPKHWWNYAFAGILFFGAGISLLLVEKLFPVRYPQMSQPEISRALLASSVLHEAEPSATCLQEILARDDVSFQQGRALYPRYYEAKGGESFTDSFGYKAVDQGRLVFTLMRQGQLAPRIVFPMDDSPSFFPHASDVTLVYGGDGKAWFAFVKKENAEALYVSTDFDVSKCR